MGCSGKRTRLAAQLSLPGTRRLKKLVALFSLLLLVSGYGLLSANPAHAFSCSATSLSTTVTVVPSSDGASYPDLILNPSPISCNGFSSYNDGLRVYGPPTVQTVLKGYAVEYMEIAGVRTNAPIPYPHGNQFCTWANTYCGSGNGSINLTPVKVKLKRSLYTPGMGGFSLAAGTSVLVLNQDQRSTACGGDGWCGNRFQFNMAYTLSAPLVVPSNTCVVNGESDQTVTLRSVAAADIQSHGTGRYPGESTNFHIDLTCDLHTVIKMKFTGTALSGASPANTVLANSNSSMDSIGFQILYKETPVTLNAAATTVVADSLAQESLNFTAYYYFKGGPEKNAGTITAQAIYTLEYQ